jgi:uncharacterized protein (TIRG00374 family)
MTDAKPLARRTAALLIVVGIFIFILYLRLFVPFGEVLSAFDHANLAFYSLAFGALILSVAFAALTWQFFLRMLSIKSAFLKAFQFIWVGYFVDLLIPAESLSSDISRIYLMSKQSGENAGKVTASVLAHRILATVISFSGLVVSSLYFILVYNPSAILTGFIAFIAGVSMILLTCLIYFSTRRKTTERIVNWIVNLAKRLSRGHWNLENLKSQAMRMLESFHEGTASLGTQPAALAFPIAFSILSWFFDLLIVVFVFLSLGVLGMNISFSAIVIVYFITVGIEDIPLGIPAHLGIMEIAMTSLYTLFGVPIGLSAVATVLIRAITFWVRMLIGGFAAQLLGIKALLQNPL